MNNIRAFYRAFPIWNAVRTELSWTHYRIISRVEIQCPGKKRTTLRQ
ncbi:hypothetical protein [Dyadobacter sp. 3J3]